MASPAPLPSRAFPSDGALRLMLATARDAIVAATADGAIAYANPAAEKLFDYGPGELPGKPLTALMPERFQEAHLAGIHRHATAASGLPRSRTVVQAGIRRDGTEFPIELSLSSWASSESRYFTAIIRDIGDRVESETGAQRLVAIVESSSDAILSSDLDAIILTWNPAAERIFGYTASEAVGMSIANLLPADRSHEFRRIMTLIHKGQSIDRYDTVAVRKDASSINVLLTISPIHGPPGTVVGASIILKDVTEQKKIEQTLMLAGRMASLGTLAAGVAHEINNPLAYITANLDLVAHELREVTRTSPMARMEEILEAIDEARSGADRVHRIVRGLRSFSRADCEQRVPVELDRVIEISVNIAHNEIRHRARLVKDYQPTPLVIADEARLSQVFINLLVNAAQAIPAGQAARNQIRIATLTDNDGRAVVEIQDTGCGISESAQPHVFEPFFTTKPVGAGTGLGLSLCHGIVAAHGGAITFQTEVGTGTIFRVVLPAAQPNAEPDIPAPSTPASLPSRRGRVLIVDDDPLVMSSLRRILSREHQVVTAASGREALDRLASGPRFDTVICDIMMPEMTGMDLYQEVSKHSPDQAERFIFLTGGAFTPQTQAFLDQVPNPRMEKPFDVANLRAFVRSQVR